MVDESLYPTAEVSVLGSMLIDERCVGLVMQRIRAEDFTNGTLRHLFEAARDVWTANEPFDPVTVVAKAGKDYQEYAAMCMRLTPTAANVEAYVKVLRDEAQLTKLRKLCMEIASSHELDDACALLAKANGILTGRPRRKSASYTEMLTAYLDRQNDPTPPDYLDFGIKQINQRVHISPGRFVIIGADSSVGKTAFALQLAYTMAAGGKRVGFYSYETSTEDAADRIFANAANVSLPRTKLKKLIEADWYSLSDEGRKSDSIHLRVIETAGCTVDELKAETLAGRFDVVFIDYVQLIPASNRRADNRYQTVTEVSMDLHTMAQQLGVTVIALSQVTLPEKDKNGKRRRVTKTDLKDSRQLNNDADAILMLDYKDTGDPKGPRVLYVDKNKDGELGCVNMSFDAEHMRFAYLPPQRSKEQLLADIDRKTEESKAAVEQMAKRQQTFEELPDDGPLPF